MMNEGTINILSQANIDTLINICERFFLEKYNINVSHATLSKTIPVLLNKIIAYYAKKPPLPVLSEVNKIAMQHMKDFILSKMDINLQNEVPSSLPLPPQRELPPPPQRELPELHETRDRDREREQKQEMVYNPYDLYKTTQTNNVTSASIAVPIAASTSAPPDSVKDSVKDQTEDEFFAKLKNLENTRHTINIVIKSGQIENFLSPPSTNTIHQQHQQQPIIIQQMVSNDGLMTTKTQIINASDRDWIYFRDRYMFIWNGVTIDSSMITIKQILLPRRVAKITPVITLEITGSSNKIIEVVCILDHCGVSWDIWKCVGDQKIQNISTPWTCKLLTGSKTPLHILGKDGSLIKTASRSYNNNTQITIEPHMSCIEVGAQLKIFSNTHKDTEILLYVVSINGKNIEVEGDATHYIDGLVCNMCYQPYIILEYNASV